MNLEMLVYASVKWREHHLWRTSGKLISSADIDCIGVGDSSIIRYFFDTFTWSSKALTLAQFLPLAFYVMIQAKKYIDGCGGRTDCIVFQEDSCTHANDPREIKWTEQQVEHLEEQIVRLVGEYADKDVTAENFRKVLDKFTEELEEYRGANSLTHEIDISEEDKKMLAGRKAKKATN